MQYLSLPYQFSDGACLSAYVIEQEQGYLVSDDGATLFKIMCSDVDLSDRRRWQPIKNVALKYGFEMSDSGTLRKFYSSNFADDIAGELLLMMGEIVIWEASVHETGDFDLTLHMHVESLLRAFTAQLQKLARWFTGRMELNTSLIFTLEIRSSTRLSLTRSQPAQSSENFMIFAG